MIALALGALALNGAGCGEDERRYGNSPDPDTYVGELASDIAISAVSVNQAVALPPAGEKRAVEWLDADGRLVGSTAGFFQSFSVPPAGLLVLPDPPSGATGVRVPECGTTAL